MIADRLGANKGGSLTRTALVTLRCDPHHCYGMTFNTKLGLVNFVASPKSSSRQLRRTPLEAHFIRGGIVMSSAKEASVKRSDRKSDRAFRAVLAVGACSGSSSRSMSAIAR